jgi:hypothetical protein
MISEVDINVVSISPFDEDINIDNKIKKAGEDDYIIDEVENKRKRRVFKKLKMKCALTGERPGMMLTYLSKFLIPCLRFDQLTR